ncbi:HEAT repeat domain-containing protein [Hymenobacter sp. RP-2-7]|uniref:HEAT repeat domain-containing protein n=1 Tax=Hymenobacter polaris TaxID=2682546 RepID=A0A7Y0ABQ6_9BACT|nr:HEAT repeat domain-containing protein [Hymenobacter polaris]NML64388.1 HEAT repeat domain-containing protein [Hymenobacter polaris]
MLLPATLPPWRPTAYRLLNLQAGEGRTVLLFSLYSLLMGAVMAVYYTCTTSLFLTSFDRQQLPLAFVASGVGIYALGRVVQWAQRRLPYGRVNAGLLLATVLTVGGLLVASALHPSKWLYFALFLWNRGFTYVNGVVFWTTMGRVFGLEQSKRLFGFIGVGEVVASIISYLSVPLLLRVISTDWLLLLAFGLLALCAVLMAYIRQRYRGVLEADKPASAAAGQPAAAGRPAAPRVSAAAKAYYALLAVLALLPVFGLVYVEFMFTVQSKQVYPDKQSLASFLGLFFGLCSVVELFIKVFLYNKLISAYSVRLGIVLLPVLLLFSYGLAASYGAAYGATSLFFAYIALSRFFMSAVRRAISDPAFQVLFQPIPAAERTQLQSRIEGGPKALGNILPGLLLLALNSIRSVTPVDLCYVFLLLLLGWVTLAFRIQNGYRAMLNDAVMRSAQHVYQQLSGRQPAAPAPVPAPRSFPALVALAASPAPADRATAAVELSYSGRYHACQHVMLLLHDEDPAVREAAITAAGRLGRAELWPRLFEHLGQPRYRAAAVAALLAVGAPILPSLARLLKQGNLPDGQQVQLVELAATIGGEAALRLLRGHLQHPRQCTREAVFEGLAQLHHRATVTERPYLGQQLDEYLEQMVWLMAARVDLASFASDSDVLNGLRAEKTQLMSKIVTLLVILYGDNRSDVIRELIDYQNNELRGYLLELISTTLPAQVRDRILLLFTPLPLAEKLRRADAYYPQQQLSVEERLLDILNRDYNKLGSWVKAAVVLALPQHLTTDPTLPLVAAATTPDAVLAEAALYLLHQLNPTRFEQLRPLDRHRADGQQLAERVAAGLTEAELLLRHKVPPPPFAPVAKASAPPVLALSEI